MGSESALVLALAGPTGSGKSELALQLAAELPIDIVSVDATQIYRGLDIGSAKPAPSVQAAVRHHVINLREPHERYSVGEFVRDAEAAIHDIHRRGRIPLLVGGTMLYFRAWLDGLAVLPGADPALRAELDARASQVGWPALHAELASVDSVAAARIHPNDAQRIQRALEVQRLTGRSLSELTAAAIPASRDYAIVRWALVPQDRAALHVRIAKRFTAMLEQGFLEEVRQLAARGNLTARHASMRAVGYRQLWSHVQGAITLQVACEQAVAATRQLAKRQLTWINADAAWQRLDPSDSVAVANWRQQVVEIAGKPALANVKRPP